MIEVESAFDWVFLTFDPVQNIFTYNSFHLAIHLSILLTLEVVAWEKLVNFLRNEIPVTERRLASKDPEIAEQLNLLWYFPQ